MRSPRDDAEMAGRLRHDLGKSLRLSAPETPEREIESLRERLRADVLATRSGPGGTFSAEEVFAGWLRDGGDVLGQKPAYADTVGRIAEGVAELGRLGGRLAELSRGELEKADALTRQIAEDCRALVAAARGAGL